MCFRCYPRVICRVWDLCFLPRASFFSFFGLFVLQDIYIIYISSGGRKFEIFREHVNCWLLAFCIITYTPGSAVWLTVASYAASYHGCHIYLCPASPENLVFHGFHRRSRRRYYNENTGTTRLFEQIRSDQKALENQRFTVARRQIYKNILTSKKFAKRVFLFR